MGLGHATHELERVVYRRLGTIDNCYRDPRDFCSYQGYSKTLEAELDFLTYSESSVMRKNNTICPAPMTPSRLTLCAALGDAETENKRIEPTVDLDRGLRTDILNIFVKTVGILIAKRIYNARAVWRRATSNNVVSLRLHMSSRSGFSQTLSLTLLLPNPDILSAHQNRIFLMLETLETA